MTNPEISLLGIAIVVIAVIICFTVLHIIQNPRKQRTPPTEAVDIVKYQDRYRVRRIFPDGDVRWLKRSDWRTASMYTRWTWHIGYATKLDTVEEAQQLLDECNATPYDESYDKVQVVRTISTKQPDNYLTLTPELMDAVREGNRDKEIEILAKMEKLRHG